MNPFTPTPTALRQWMRNNAMMLSELLLLFGICGLSFFFGLLVGLGL